MKIALLFLFALAGFVSSQESQEYEVLEDAADDVLQAFAEGLDEITPLSGTKDDADKVKSELVKMLQDALHRTIEKIKTRIDDHHQKANDLIEKAHELAQRLKAHHADLGEKARNSIKNLRGQARDHLRKILDSFKQREKRSIRDYLDIHRRAALLPQIQGASDVVHYTIRGEKCKGPCNLKGPMPGSACLLESGEADYCSPESGVSVNGKRCRDRCQRYGDKFACLLENLEYDHCSVIAYLVTFFEQKNYQGEKLQGYLEKNICTQLPKEWQGRANSFNTSQLRVDMYDQSYCKGNSTHDVGYNSDLSDKDWGNKVVSVFIQ